MATPATSAGSPTPPPTSPTSPPPRHRRSSLLPRSGVAIVALIVALAIGAALSGAVLYAYYEYRLDQNEVRIDSYVEGFDERLATANEIIEAEQQEAQNAIRAELDPLQQVTATGETLARLRSETAASVYFVTTLDEAGQPSVGSAFVVFSDDAQSFLLTSYTTVRAATRQPAPAISVRKGDEVLPATLHTWSEARDLALLVVDRGGLERLPWAATEPPLPLGERLFAISGLGGSGASITQGSVADVSAAGVQHDAAIGVHFQGGPLVNSDGEVIALASRNYSPLGFNPQAVFFGVPIRDSCAEVLRCPEGEVAGAGERP